MDKRSRLLLIPFPILCIALCLASQAGAQPSTIEVDGEKYKIDRSPTSADPTRRPVVVLIHGIDGMEGKSGEQITGFAKQLEKEGFLVVVPYYFGDGDGSAATPLPDLVELRLANRKDYPPRVAAAVKFATEQPDADKGRVGLVGFSLGGGLALEHAEAAASGVIKAVVDFFGYIPDDGIYRDVKNLPPTLVFHNEKDKVVLIQTSKKLVESLKSASVEHDHRFFDNGDPERRYHTMLPDSDADKESRKLTIDWLKKYL